MKRHGSTCPQLIRRIKPKLNATRINVRELVTVWLTTLSVGVECKFSHKRSVGSGALTTLTEMPLYCSFVDMIFDKNNFKIFANNDSFLNRECT